MNADDRPARVVSLGEEILGWLALQEKVNDAVEGSFKEAVSLREDIGKNPAGVPPEVAEAVENAYFGLSAAGSALSSMTADALVFSGGHWTEMEKRGRA